MGSYFIAIDGGGSKLISILFDETFKPLGVGHGGSVNPNFAPQSVIEKSINDCLTELLSGRKDLVIEKVYVTFVGDVDLLLRTLNHYVTVKQVRRLSEAETGLFAGLQCGDGILALSGTGSDVFYMHQGKLLATTGGWGAIICEEGSGYYIGRMALTAAIYDMENRGPHTSLTEMIQIALGVTSLHEGVGKIYQSKNEVKQIATLTRCVSQAAASGDSVALSILHTNAHYMVEQTLPLLKQFPTSLPIIVAGGVWKSYQFFEQYCKEITDYNPTQQIRLPLVEPVVGNIIAAYYDWQETLQLPSIESILENYYSFRYELPNWKSL